jgi:hypothetical protein
VQALPLLSLPIMYMLRRRLPSQQLQLSVSWNAGPALRVGGVF